MTTASATPSATTSTLLSPVFTPSGGGRAFDAGIQRGHIAISHKQSNGAFSLMIGEATSQDGPPPHIHSLEEETFHILEGRFEFRVGGQTIEAGPGDTLFAPRHIPHTFRCISEGGGSALSLSTPGESFEKFFLEMCEGGLLAQPIPGPAQIAAMIALAERHGIQMLPPSAMEAPSIAASAPAPLAPVLTRANGGRAFNGGDYWGHIMISHEQSGGAFTLINLEAAFGSGPPPHIHSLEEETFYILEGRFEIWVDGETIEAGPGDTVLAPRHVAHTWRCVSEEGGRIFLLITPGESFEKFFLSMTDGGMLGAPTAEDIAAMNALAARHGMQMLPPLTER